MRDWIEMEARKWEDDIGLDVGAWFAVKIAAESRPYRDVALVQAPPSLLFAGRRGRS